MYQRRPRHPARQVRGTATWSELRQAGGQGECGQGDHCLKAGGSGERFFSTVFLTAFSKFCWYLFLGRGGGVGWGESLRTCGLGGGGRMGRAARQPLGWKTVSSS